MDEWTRRARGIDEAKEVTSVTTLRRTIKKEKLEFNDTNKMVFLINMICDENSTNEQVFRAWIAILWLPKDFILEALRQLKFGRTNRNFNIREDDTVSIPYGRRLTPFGDMATYCNVWRGWRYIGDYYHD